jgi:5'-AMP-activated protein kinase catalytic alpha subunit
LHDNIKIADFGFASMMEVDEGYQRPEFETIIEGRESDMKTVECGNLPINTRPAFHRQPSKVMRKMSTVCGTSLYMAPEIVKGDGYYGDKADIWSCGVVLYYLLTYSFPYDDDSNSKNKDNLMYEIPNSFSADLVDLLSKILDRNPVTRYSARNILNHRWFNSERDIDVHATIEEPITRKITKQGRIATGNHFQANGGSQSRDKLNSCILSNLPMRECVSISGRALTKNSWVHMEPDERTVSLKASKMTPSGLAMIELDFKVIDGSKTILNLVIFGNKSGGLDDIISLMSYIKEVLS